MNWSLLEEEADMPGKKSIYLVEDESHIQQLVKYNLEANGYSVSTF